MEDGRGSGDGNWAALGEVSDLQGKNRLETDWRAGQSGGGGAGSRARGQTEKGGWPPEKEEPGLVPNSQLDKSRVCEPPRFCTNAGYCWSSIPLP